MLINILKKEIPGLIIDLLLQTRTNSQFSRCHEIARYLGERLNEGDLSTSVKTGEVNYPNFNDLKPFLSYIGLEDSRLLGRPKGEKLDKKVRRTIQSQIDYLMDRCDLVPPVEHSWCDIGDIRIDYHNVLNCYDKDKELVRLPYILIIGEITDLEKVGVYREEQIPFALRV